MSPSTLARSRVENTIVWGRARHADFGPCAHSLSIRAAWGGVQACHFEGRSVCVDDDTFLILNAGRACATTVRASEPVETLTIFFKPGLVEEAQFHEHLQLHDGLVSPVLKYLRAHLRRGLTDEAWYEEHLRFLLERMCQLQRRRLDQLDSLALVRSTTRREVFRRVNLATDYLHTHYSENIDLELLAATAFLSKFHFLRLFTLIHGTTPHDYLQRKRVDAAVRLLESTPLTMSEVAARVGFANASTLLRRVKQRTQLSPRQIRDRHRKANAPRSPRAHSQSEPREFAIVA